MSTCISYNFSDNIVHLRGKLSYQVGNTPSDLYPLIYLALDLLNTKKGNTIVQMYMNCITHINFGGLR